MWGTRSLRDVRISYGVVMCVRQPHRMAFEHQTNVTTLSLVGQSGFNDVHEELACSTERNAGEASQQPCRPASPVAPRLTLVRMHGSMLRGGSPTSQPSDAPLDVEVQLGDVGESPDRHHQSSVSSLWGVMGRFHGIAGSPHASRPGTVGIS